MLNGIKMSNKISIIGCGYVGLVSGALLADRGNKVICVDNNPEIIENLNSGKIHIYEPGLEEIIKRNLDTENLSFTTDLDKAVHDSNIIPLTVGTSSNDGNSLNIDHIKAAARDVGRSLHNTSRFKVVVGKSTVPQGTYKILSDTINEELGSKPKVKWAYVSNPEFLAEGNAIENFSRPARIVIGTYSDKAFSIMEELYHPFNIRKERIERVTPINAEYSKLMSNTFLALKIAAINEFARIIDKTPKADVDEIRRVMCADPRIGYEYMFPGPGFGGSCFKKDIEGLVQQSIKNGYKPLLLDQINLSNEAHKNYMGERITNLLKQKENPIIVVWGLTFKPNTDDMRNAASIPIITGLLNRGAKVIAYDPKNSKARKIFGKKIIFANNKYEAIQSADALVLLTEWREFDSPDFNRLSKEMHGKQIFDLRNRWLPETANSYGFDYFGVGRNYPLKK